MRTDLINAIADYMDVVAAQEKYFYMGRWITPDGVRDKELSCGTASCAIGHAYFGVPALREMGLTFAFSRSWATPVYGDDDEFDAIAALLEIPEEDALHLFSGHNAEHDSNLFGDENNETPTEVAKHLRAYAAGERFNFDSYERIESDEE